MTLRKRLLNYIPVLFLSIVLCIFGVCQAQSERSIPDADHFYALSQNNAGAITSASDDYFHGLPLAAQLDVARRLARDTRVTFIVYGSQALIKLERYDEAAVVLGNMVLNDQDITGLAWSWFHGEQPCLSGEMLWRINAYLANRYPTLNSIQQKRVDALLYNGKPLDRKASEQLVAALKQEVLSCKMKQRQ